MFVAAAHACSCPILANRGIRTLTYGDGQGQRATAYLCRLRLVASNGGPLLSRWPGMATSSRQLRGARTCVHSPATFAFTQPIQALSSKSAFAPRLIAHALKPSGFADFTFAYFTSRMSCQLLSVKSAFCKFAHLKFASLRFARLKPVPFRSAKCN